MVLNIALFAGCLYTPKNGDNILHFRKRQFDTRGIKDMRQIVLKKLGYEKCEEFEVSQLFSLFRARNRTGGTVLVKEAAHGPDFKLAAARICKEFDICSRLGVAGFIKPERLIDEENEVIGLYKDNGYIPLSHLLSLKRLETGSALTIAANLAGIVSLLHDAGYIHRDIQPHNILVDHEQFSVILHGFGIASLIPNSAHGLQGSFLLGISPTYMSPELSGRINRLVDYRTDLYSLGVILFEMLSGQPPFISNEPLELIHAHVARKPPVLSDIAPDIPATVSEIVARLLAKSAEERYQGARGLYRDLIRCRDEMMRTGAVKAFPIAEHDPPTRFELPQNFYGRTAEIEILGHGLAMAAGGKLQVIMVSGDPGIGKTSLVQELRKSIFEKRGWFVSGKYDLLGRGTPYGGICGALSELWRRLLMEEPDRLDICRRNLRECLGQNIGVIIEMTPGLAAITGNPPDIPNLEPLESKNRIKHCFQQAIRALALHDTPLVIFLDDLQWADPSSIELLESALEKGLGNLLLIGAYRDNEISERHPLIQALDNIESKGISVEHLSLGPLDIPDIRVLTADALRITTERATPVADLIFRKTAGNPFFSRSLLMTIHEEGLLHLSHDGGWTWDIDRIARIEAVGNVFDLATRKIKNIPERIRHTVSMAAAIGPPLEIATIASVCGISEEEAEADLMEACRARIMVYREDGYQFLHDRLQESAYDLIPVTKQAETHLRIGRFLAERRTRGPQNIPIFTILDHLNRASKLLLTPAEREETARLNLEAGMLARSAAAFPAAYQYFSSGLSLLVADAWLKNHDLALKLFTQAAEAALLTADFRESDRLVTQIFSNTSSILDKIPAYEIQIAIAHARLKETEAIRITLDALRLLGIDIPEEPSAVDVNQATLNIKLLVHSSFSTPGNPQGQEPDREHLAAMKLLARTAIVVGMVNHPLYLIIVHALFKLAIRYPQSQEAPVAYLMAGGVLCYLHYDYESGARAGNRGMELLRQSASPHWQSFCHFIHAIDIQCWRCHYAGLADDLARAYRLGFETGDLLTACISAYYVCEASLYGGMELSRLEKTVHGYRAETSRSGAQRISSGLLHLEQFVKSLINGVDADSLAGADTLSTNESWQAWHVRADQTVQEITLCHEIMAMLTYRYSEQALETALRIHGTPAGGVTGFLPSDFYISVCIFDALIIGGIDGQEHLLEIANSHLGKVLIKAKACPGNYRHKLDLLNALRQQYQGDTLQAMELFDLAIEGAQLNHYVNDEAIAAELAAEFYLRLGRKRIASDYLHQAVAAYTAWGAWGKLDQFNIRYPDLLSLRHTSAETVRHTQHANEPDAESSSEALDILSIERLAAALSQELDLPKLLKMLMGILLQSAGAQHGSLLREDEGAIIIEACGSVDDDTVHVFQKLPLEKSEQISRSIVRHVSRSRETVVIGDASQDERFAGTPYISREKPKSILCTPVQHRGKTVALIYLENNRSRDVFNAERIKAIRLISSQAAIALENARLLDGLKQEVRTRRQAVDNLRRALEEVAQLKERLHAENTYLKEEFLGTHGFEDIVGKSGVLKMVLKNVSQVASTDATVLILGETGTGKELIARAIHSRSSRKNSPMVRVNCATLPASLIESELFGHEKGAFTGATAKKMGRFELAEGGTIFLDEIGELPLELQAKLLRVLQEGEFERLGSSITQRVNVRVIAATNRNLKQEVEEGRFRSDLYFRLSVFPIDLPPLRERTEDIPLLAWYFITKKQAGLGKSITKIPKGIMESFISYGWPGNIRELENVIERAVILTHGTTLSLNDSLGMPAHKEQAPQQEVSNLDEVERKHIIAVLDQCGWRVKGNGNAAEKLGLNPSTLTFRMKKLGIKRSDHKLKFSS